MRLTIEIDAAARFSQDGALEVAYRTEGTMSVEPAGEKQSGLVESIAGALILVTVAGSVLDWISHYYHNIRSRADDFVVVDLSEQEPRLVFLPGSDRLKGHVLIRGRDGELGPLIPPPGPSGLSDSAKRLLPHG